MASRIGSTCILLATIALGVVVLGTPRWNSIYFIRVVNTKAGIWGYCQGSTCSAPSLGYTLPDAIKDLYDENSMDMRIGSTKLLILHAVAAGVSAIAYIFALCGNLVTGILASIFSLSALLIVLISLIVDVALFVPALGDLPSMASGTSANNAALGPAFWLTVASGGLLLIASLTVCCTCGNNRSPKTKWVKTAA